MSVLNQMLRDLERRGAMSDVVAAAGTATVARPALPAPKAADPLRRWVWAGVLAVAAALVGAHTWLDQRARGAAAGPTPLGVRQFGSVAETNRSSASPGAPPMSLAAAPPSPAASAPAVDAPIPPAPIEAAPAPDGQPTQPVQASVPARPRPAARTAAAAALSRAPVVPPAAPSTAAGEAGTAPIVVRVAGDVTRDVERASELISRGRANEATGLLQQVLAREPGHVMARRTLAALLAESGRRELALRTLLAGVEVEPARFAAPAAQMQAEAGDVQGALRTMALVPAAQRDAGNDALTAGLHQRAGEFAAAVAAYRRALAHPQPDPVWWVGLGVALESLGQASDAHDAFVRAAQAPALPAAVRPFVQERMAALAQLAARAEQARRADLANVF